MAKYRKLPEIIDADQFSWSMEDGIMRYNERIPRDATKYSPDLESSKYPGYLGRYDEYNAFRGFEQGNWIPYISTLEGDHMISEGDFIITGIKGERYPCKADIFEKTYEKV